MVRFFNRHLFFSIYQQGKQYSECRYLLRFRLNWCPLWVGRWDRNGITLGMNSKKVGRHGYLLSFEGTLVPSSGVPYICPLWVFWDEWRVINVSIFILLERQGIIVPFHMNRQKICKKKSHWTCNCGSAAKSGFL